MSIWYSNFEYLKLSYHPETNTAIHEAKDPPGVDPYVRVGLAGRTR
jgi:hypothetical protein